MREIYLDNNATTKVAPEVLKAITPFFDEYYGNAGSAHMKGQLAERVLFESRNRICRVLSANAHKVIFTSGGTESDNLAILGLAQVLKGGGSTSSPQANNHVVTTSVEHPAVLECMRALERWGFEITYVNPRMDGIVHAEDIVGALRENTILVSVMHVNNETGAIFLIEEIARCVKKRNPKCMIHSDGVQAIGKVMPDLSQIDLYAISGHKFHAPKGIGVLIIREGARIAATQYGGGQEGGLRSGTENIPGIVGLTCALELAYEDFTKKIECYKSIRDGLISGLKEVKDVIINSPGLSSPQTVNASFLGVPGEVLLNALSEQGIFVSTGSACSRRKGGVSHVLAAQGLRKEQIDSSIRFSLSRYTTLDEIKKTMNVLKEIVPKLRAA